MVAKKAYDNNSIDQLEGAERVRTRPAAVLGSDGLAGAQHGVTEIIGNVADEKTAGYGSEVDVFFHKDRSITIRDYGRGVPMGWNEAKQNWNWHLIYEEMYAGGKYATYQDDLKALDAKNGWRNFNPQDYNYLFSIGLNGLGAASTQMSSEFFDVTSYRDGEASTMKFKAGYPVLDELLVEPTTEPNGTYIHWKPDSEVFTDVNIPSEFIYKIALSAAYASGLTVNYKDELEGKEETIEAGNIETLINSKYPDLADGSNIITKEGLNHGHTREKGGDAIYIFKYEIALAFVDKGGQTYAFHNAIQMQGDPERSAHHRAINETLAAFFKKQMRDNGVKYNSTDEFMNRIVIGINSYSNIASYANQTKDLVDNDFIRAGLSDALRDMLEIEMSKGNQAIQSIIYDMVEEANMREQLAEQRKQLRAVKKISKNPVKTEKFAASEAYRKHQINGSQLFIVEGDSAAGSTKSARNAKFQAVFPIRGKLINAAKAPIEKLLNNAEVQAIVKIIGGGITLPGTEQRFNIDKCRFERITFLTDADEDGYQIRVLLFLLFYKLMPELIDEGRLYIAESPLYILKYPNGIDKYAKNKAERKELEAKYGLPTTVQRNKGLGEVDATDLAKTTVNPKYTNYENEVQIKFDTTDETVFSVVDTLYGKDAGHNRKSAILALLGAKNATDDWLADDTKEFSDNVEFDDIEDQRTIKDVIV